MGTSTKNYFISGTERLITKYIIAIKLSVALTSIHQATVQGNKYNSINSGTTEKGYIQNILLYMANGEGGLGFQKLVS